MPNLDGTGPQGKGTMSGRKKGRCKDTKTPQTEKSEVQSTENKEDAAGVGRGGKPRGGGKGKGQGKGRGRGLGNK
jgi:hypothetical protein